MIANLLDTLEDTVKKHQQQILTTQLLILDVDASKNRLLKNSQQLKKIPQMMRMLQMLMVEVFHQ